MANQKDARKLYGVGQAHVQGRDQCGFMMVDNTIIYNICRACKDRAKGQLSVMLYLLGCAQDGTFKIAEETVLNRLGITHSTYFKALDAWEELKFIDRSEKGIIKIMYDNILAFGTSISQETDGSNQSRKGYQEQIEKSIVKETDDCEESRKGYKKSIAQETDSDDQSPRRDSLVINSIAQETNGYPEITREQIESLFVNPEFLDNGLVRNSGRIFKIV